MNNLQISFNLRPINKNVYQCRATLVSDELLTATGKNIGKIAYWAISETQENEDKEKAIAILKSKLKQLINTRHGLPGKRGFYKIINGNEKIEEANIEIV